ncbi:heme ABC transporter permease CcmC [Microbulbifer sp. OS29]|uniref:Heme exporter protein C n=1 Tax=Microbulbifer okhotskensis TaxID=2926617 RepID=A0A9X2J6E2_9GAMM|nr:heme ABC transporter permease CcmC [Microbulbifer okhotskensis]MCO1334515.1 heme ABC transporter permease CcmC [Microbulbifer okhotskensis]
MNWQWFHRLGSPRWFYQKTGAWLPWLALASVVLLSVGSVWGLGFVYEHGQQGNSYRIIYIHVPAALLALAGYYVMAISGAIGLIWRMKLSFAVMRAAASIGAVLSFICLVTGSLWGKPTWGTYWEWEARMTSMLILLFLYIGVIALSHAASREQSADKASALLALVGTVNIPIIYWSVNWWNSLHQRATLRVIEESRIDPVMFYPLLIMIIGFYCMYAWTLLTHTRTLLLKREMRTKWAQDELLGGR